MNKLLTVFFLCMFLNGVVFPLDIQEADFRALDIVGLQERDIAKKVEHVHQIMQRRRLMRTAIYVAQISLVSYGIYRFYCSFFAQPAVVEPMPEPADQPTQSWLDWVRGVGGDVCSLSTVRRASGVVAETCLTAVAQHYMHSLERQYGVAETVAWYAANHAFFKATMSEAYKYAQQLELESHARSYSFIAIIDASNAVIIQMADLIAFMRYKSQFLSPEKAAQARRIAQFVFQQVNEFSNNLQQLVDQRSLRGYADLLRTYEALFDRECARYARIEGSMWLDIELIRSLIEHHIPVGH